MSAVIEMMHIVKTFGSVRALDGLDLSVAQGEVHGFLGPNGSGKSTTIRILLGQMRADAGTSTLLGRDPWRDAVSLHRRLAYVPDDVTLWPNLSGGEVIDLLGRLRGGIDARRRDELLERFELDPRKKGRTYSKGNRQKVAIVAALSSDVELLIMDEPTTGLDPLMEAVFQDCIHAERERGRTVLLSSHILSEVEALCDRVSIIRAGVVVETGTLAEMRHLTRTTISAEVDTVPDLAAAPGVHDLVIEGHRIRMDVETAELDAVVRALSGGGRAQPHRESAHARGAVPAALRRHRRAADRAGERGRHEAAPRPARAGGVPMTTTVARATPVIGRRRSTLTGTWTLVRLALRRDRIQLLAWILGIGAVAASTFATFAQLYPNEAERQALAAGITLNPAFLALTGPVASTSLGGMTAWRIGVLGTTLIGLMALVTVVRHTRADEETGRSELLASGVVGRAAPLASAVVVATGASVVIGLIVAAAGIGVGEPAAGSVLLGASLAAAGFVLAGVAAVTAQLVENARTATALAAAVLAVGFLLRAVGDVEHSVSWLGLDQPPGPRAASAPLRGQRRSAAADLRAGRRRAARCRSPAAGPAGSGPGASAIPARPGDQSAAALRLVPGNAVASRDARGLAGRDRRVRSGHRWHCGERRRPALQQPAGGAGAGADRRHRQRHRISSSRRSAASPGWSPARMRSPRRCGCRRRRTRTGWGPCSRPRCRAAGG